MADELDRRRRERDRAMAYKLIGRDGRPYLSKAPGTLGGHRRTKVYGRLDCPGAALWIAKGHYVKHRVFFADEAIAIAAGYRPCARCLPAAYAEWKRSSGAVRQVGPPSPLSESSEPS